MKIITAHRGRGCRIVCAHSLKQFDNNYLAINTIAKSLSTSIPRLVQLALKLQLKVLKIKVLPKGYTTSFIERNSSEMLLAAFKQQCEIPSVKKHTQGTNNRGINSKRRAKIAKDRNIKAVKRYLHNLTNSRQKLPRSGNKPSKVAIAQASGIDRNAFYKYPEVQRLLDDHIKQEVKVHDIGVGSRIEILEQYLKRIRGGANSPPLKQNGKPCKRQIALEAGVSRSVFYTNGDKADRLLEKYLGASA